VFHVACRPTGAARVALAALIGAGFVVATAVPAGAHTAVEASSPKEDAKLEAAPSQVLLDFTEPIRTSVSRAIVQGPDGRRYESGAAQVAGDKLVQPLRPLGAPGLYLIEFRVVASDGHPLVGELKFTLTKPGPAAGGTRYRAQAAPTARVGIAGTNGVPTWAPWAGGAAAVIFAAGAVWFGRRVTRGLD
jgi:copper resistance protein C